MQAIELIMCNSFGIINLTSIILFTITYIEV